MRVRTWLVTLLAVVAIPATATAHADITAIGVTDGGDTRVVLSAPVEEVFLRVAPSEARIRRDPADPQAVIVSGAGGAFRISGMSRDGHAFSGRTIGAAAHRDGGLAIAGRLALLTGLLGLLGLIAFRFGVVGPAWRSGGPRPPGTGDGATWRDATAGALATSSRGWWRAGAAMLAITVVGLLVAPIGLLVDIPGVGAGDLGTLIGETRWGVSWMLQVAGVLGAAAVGIALRRSQRAAQPDPGSGWGVAVGVPLVLAVVALAATGHASSGTDAGLGMAIDAVHLAATAAWLGGLAGLIVVVPRAVARLGASDGTRLAAAVVVRFSGLAITCVAALVVTGVYRALAELSEVGDLIHTGYGRALGVKLILFAILLCGGAYNRLVLHPRLERAALGLRDDDGGAAGRLRTSAGAELVLAAAVMVSVALLVSLPPP